MLLFLCLCNSVAGDDYMYNNIKSSYTSVLVLVTKDTKTSTTWNGQSLLVYINNVYKTKKMVGVVHLRRSRLIMLMMAPKDNVIFPMYRRWMGRLIIVIIVPCY